MNEMKKKGGFLDSIRNYQAQHQNELNAAGRLRQALYVLAQSEQIVKALTKDPNFTETPNSELRSAITTMARSQETMLNTLVDKIKGAAQPGGYLEELKDVDLDDPRSRAQLSRHVTNLAVETWGTWKDDDVSFDRIQKLLFLSLMTYYRITPSLPNNYQVEYDIAKHQKLDTSLAITSAAAKIESAVSQSVASMIDDVPAMHKVVWGNRVSESGVRGLVEDVMLPEADARLEALLNSIEDETDARPAGRDIHVARRAMLRIVSGEMVNIIQHEKSAFLREIQSLRKADPTAFREYLATDGLLPSWVTYRLQLRRDAYPSPETIFAHLGQGVSQESAVSEMMASERQPVPAPSGGFSPPRMNGSEHPGTEDTPDASAASEPLRSGNPNNSH